jgi:hypothetical protein
MLAILSSSIAHCCEHLTTCQTPQYQKKGKGMTEPLSHRCPYKQVSLAPRVEPAERWVLDRVWVSWAPGMGRMPGSSSIYTET